MADLPESLQCGLNANSAVMMEDYTDWQPTAEELSRLDQYEIGDPNTEDDWKLQGGDEKWRQ